MSLIIRKTLSLPLVVLRDLLTFIPIYDKLKVMRWICILTESADDVLGYITALTLAYEPKEFEQPALEQMRVFKDARFAAVIAKAYLSQNKPVDARRCIDAAVESDCTNKQVLLLMQYYLWKEGDQFTQKQLIELMLQRDDLPPEATKVAWIGKCWQYIENKDIENAEIIADKILEIEENAIAMLVKWIASFNKNEQAAKAFFLRANQIWEHKHFNTLAAQGWYVLGNMTEAAKYLKKSIREGFIPEKGSAFIEEIMQSPEYEQL